MSDRMLNPDVYTVRQFLLGENARPNVIPRYQRAYSWEKEEIINLLEDIGRSMSSPQQPGMSKIYFIGAMLCIERGHAGKEHYEIVDGQQRLTTISLIYAVLMWWARDNIITSDMEKDLGMKVPVFEHKMSEFLYEDEAQTLPSDESFDDMPELKKYRLELGKSDNLCYTQIIKNGLPQSTRKNSRRLCDAYRIIDSFFREKLDKNGIHYIRNFVNFLSSNANLIGIVISDEADPYEIFEVLNARNRELTPVDLIKNKLLSSFGGDSKALDSAYEQWQLAYDAGCNESPKNMQEYVRCHLQMRKGHKVAPKYLYRELRDALGKKPAVQAKKLLEDMEGHCHKFKAIMYKDSRIWDDFNQKNKIKSMVGYLNGYRVMYTIMFALLYMNKKQDYIFGAYRILEVFMRRTQAVRDRFSILEHYEEEFAHIARQIKQGKSSDNLLDFFNEVKKIDEDGWMVIPDESFIQQISERPKFKPTDAKSILIELANYLQSSNNMGTVIADDVTLEHIFPQNPKYSEWKKDGWNPENGLFYLENLGNMTLLNGVPNTQISNRRFSYKKEHAYVEDKCGIFMTNELCEYDQWTMEEVKNRSKQMAELAAKVWSFDFLKDKNSSPAKRKRKRKN